jgi:cell division protein FtsB
VLRNVAITLVTVAVMAAFAGWDPDTGMRSWWRLRGDHEAAERRIAELESEVQSLRSEAAALKVDPLAQERAIREDLGFARPGETVVRLPGRDASLPVP